MVTSDDNIFDGLSYEDSVYILCDRDIKRYDAIYPKLLKILSKIPIGWNGKVLKSQ
jgi:hypothetical protein